METEFGSLRICAYSDSLFVTNADQSSQLKIILLLFDKINNAYVLHYVSFESRRVARSVISAEAYAFSGDYDLTYCAKMNLEKYYNLAFYYLCLLTPKVCSKPPTQPGWQYPDM